MKPRYWWTLPREERLYLLSLLVEEGLLNADMSITELGELYIASGYSESQITRETLSPALTQQQEPQS